MDINISNLFVMNWPIDFTESSGFLEVTEPVTTMQRSIQFAHRKWAGLSVALGLCGLWSILTPADLQSLVVGLPCIALALVTWRWQGTGGAAPRVGALLALIPGFLWQSVHGAVDVSMYAFGLRALPVPSRVCWPLKLAHGKGRLLFMNIISLMPGTLSMRESGDELVVHVLDGANAQDESLAEMERRIEGVFSVSSGSRANG
ncbi:MAG: multicomponent Na+:H+ antiporter subunit E [Gammaproteobacteria bacterium]